VSGVDQGGRPGAQVFVHRMMPEVAGDVDVCARGARGVEQRIPRPTAHCDGPDDLLRITCSADSDRREGQ
jgi:hypothetical protein